MDDKSTFFNQLVAWFTIGMGAWTAQQWIALVGALGVLAGIYYKRKQTQIMLRRQEHIEAAHAWEKEQAEKQEQKQEGNNV